MFGGRAGAKDRASTPAAIRWGGSIVRWRRANVYNDAGSVTPVLIVGFT